MINKVLINPQSIVVIGASDNLQSPGGKVIYNLKSNNFKGTLYGVNPKQKEVQGIKCFQEIIELPNVDMAIIAVAAKYCVEIVRELTESKNTKAFIIFSAGFSEQDENGRLIENEIVKIVSDANATLLGPNNIGMFNTNFAGVFTTPIPKLDPKGVDFISGSGATAVFIMEAAMSKGLTFNSLYSVGNSAQIGIEDVLEYLDDSYEINISSPIKLLYIESIQNPQKLLKHAHSLIKKGAKIAAIKAGSSEAGSRAASSHTGAIANADSAVEALFTKAGIIRCYGREELINVAGVLTYPELVGKNIAIITHAGGPAVMLTDVLTKNGLYVPKISNKKSQELLAHLYAGSSVANPIDFLATGTSEQLDKIIDYCENEFDEIDAMAIIFGSPGLFDVGAVYNIIEKRIQNGKKPIYPILPSVINVTNEIKNFTSNGYFAFSDEVNFGLALTKVHQKRMYELSNFIPNAEIQLSLNEIIKGKVDYLSPIEIQEIFKILEIPIVNEFIVSNSIELSKIQPVFPLVAKVIGPIHKTDVGGVRLNINNFLELQENFEELMKIDGATGVLLQPMLKGLEIYIGAKKEGNFGHTIVCGMGGIMIEIIKDVSIGLSPLNLPEIEDMISSLKAFPIFKGIRGKKGINIQKFANIIMKISNLVQYIPAIEELDINPLLANENEIIAVDARIRIGTDYN